MSKNNKKLITFAVWITLVGIFLFLNTDPNPIPKVKKEMSQFTSDLNEELVRSIILNYKRHEISVMLNKDNQTYFVKGLISGEDLDTAYLKGIEIKYAQPTPLEKLNVWINLNFSKYFYAILPFIVFVAVLLFFLKRGKAQQNNFLTLRNSSAKLIKNGTDVTFNDIGGLEDIKYGVKDVISFLKDPKPWIDGGVKLPRGIILEGPPGTGKTLFARALASECKATFYSISGSEFVELFVGVGAARVRDLFEKARAAAPAVIFIDEIDAIGRKRSVGHGLGSEEWDNTLNQLLSCMDGFSRLDRILVVAATNRLDVLDPALMRAGRFDRSFSMKSLSTEAREQIIDVHLRGKKLSNDLSAHSLAQKISGVSGAEIETIVNEGSLAAVSRYIEAKENKLNVEMLINENDIISAYQNFLARRGRLASFDDALLESDSRFVTFRLEQNVSVELIDNKVVQGSILWASPAAIKLKAMDNSELLIRKAQVISIRS